MFRKIVRVARAVFGQKADHDFSYESGERQVAFDFAEIRVDHRNRYEFAARHLPKGGNGLDCFCGNGYGTKFLADSLDAKVHGIDGSEDAIVAARKHFSGPNSTFEYLRFPFELTRDTYDFVVCLESLEHVKEDTALLKVLVNSLRHGGRLVISTPNEAALPYEANRHFFGFHFRHYDHANLFNQLKELELKVLKIAGQNVYETNGKAVSRALPENQMILAEDDMQAQFLIYLLEKP